MSPKTIFEIFKETFSEWQEDKASRLAAALAYYTIFSLAPLLMIVIAIAGLLFQAETAETYLLEQAQNLMGSAGAEVFQQVMENASQPSASTAAALIGLAVLLFGASGVFAQLQDAMNTVWEVAPRPDLGIMATIRQRFLSFTMVLGIGFLLLVSLVLSAVLSAVSETISNVTGNAVLIGQILNFVLSFAIISLLFAMIYKILPDVEIDWSDVWIGAAVTAALFIIGNFLLGWYLGRQSFGSTYGAAGSILVLLLWVYYSAQILLFGAEFTQVYARRMGSRIAPSENAVRMNTEMRMKQGIPRSEQVEAAADRQQRQQEPRSAS